MQVDKSQEQWAEYSLLPPPAIQLKRYDSNGHRFYWWLAYDDKGQVVVKTAIGVTSLLGIVMPTSPFLTEWKLKQDDWEQALEDSSAFGTMMHMAYGQWLVNRSVDAELLGAARDLATKSGGGYDLPDKNMLSFIRWCEDYRVKPMIIEGMLVSEPIEEEQFAMTIDLLAELTITDTVETWVKDGVYTKGKNKGQDRMVKQKTESQVKKIALVDFKSGFMGKETKSFFESHLMQLIAGQRAVSHNYPDVKIDMIANYSSVGWRTRPNYAFQIWEPKPEDLQLFDCYIKIGRLKGLFSPSGNKFIPPQYNERTKSEDFRVLSYKEYVSNILLAPEPTSSVEDYVDETSPILNATKNQKP